MSQGLTRPPTPATTKYSPLYEFANGTVYPYWDLKDSGLTPYLNAVRRALASINPFSHQQVPTSERMGLNVRYGPRYYREEPFPTSASWSSKYPSHYDPLSTDKHNVGPYVKQVNFVPVMQDKQLVPRFCQRQLRAFKRCVIANDDKQQVCKQEQQNILAICPQWALNNLKERRLAVLKDQAMSNKKYREVMEVPFYNKGRTVADVPLRRWEDGSRQNLRPDTLWADDRYADVTQAEVNAARERVKRRRQANPLQHRAEIPIYDRNYEAPNRQIPLYSV